MNEKIDSIQLSNRMGLLPPYLFGSINKLKDTKRREGVDIIDMAMGNPTDPTPQPIVDKLCEVVNDSRNHRYSASAGIYNLRREVAKYYLANWDVELDPEEVRSRPSARRKDSATSVSPFSGRATTRWFQPLRFRYTPTRSSSRGAATWACPSPMIRNSCGGYAKPATP
jgi:hypothetical protein